MKHQRNRHNVNSLVIHCSATPNGKWFDMTDVNKWHYERSFKRNPHYQVGLVYPNIGYHDLITLDGIVHRGRGYDEIGAHAYGINTSSIGVCLIGTDKFTKHQWDSLRMYVEHVQWLFNDRLQIIGHNEISKKICPGFNVQDWLGNNMIPLTEHIIEI